MEPVVYVLIFVATFLGVESLFMLFASPGEARRNRARRRLRRLAARLQEAEGEEGAETLLRDRGDRLSFVGRTVQLLPGRRALDLRLYRAGLSTTPTRFLAGSLLLGAGGFALGAIAGGELAAALPLALTGALPWIHAGRRAERRRRKFEEQFPEALELMTRALRAGHSLTFAFQLVGDEMGDPIGPEFAHLSEELKFGQDLRVALTNLGSRVDACDLAYFTTAVLVQRETGGNLAELLDKLGYVIRDRFKLFGKVRSLTAVGKATANILGVWPFVMVGMLYLVGADFVELLWTERSGHLLSAFAALLVLIGYVLCRRAAEIRV